MKCPHCKKEFYLSDAKIRSTPENKYYWGVVLKLMSEETGYSENEMHELCRSMFLSEHIIHNVDGFVVFNREIPRSTSELTTVEFENYLSSIRQWASLTLNVYIPLPNEENV